MNRRWRGIVAVLLLFAALTSGCEQVPSKGSELHLLEIKAQEMSMTHAGATFHGVEYQLQLELPRPLADGKEINQLPVEVVFTGKTKELMGQERVKEFLQLQQAGSARNLYLVRVASIYRTDFDPQDISYLLEHTDEVSVYLR